MKKLQLTAAGLTFTLLALVSCSDAPKGDKATITDAQETAATTAGQSFTVDTTTSRIRFTGNGVGKIIPVSSAFLQEL